MDPQTLLKTVTGLFPEAQERPNSSPAAVRVGVGALSALMGRLRNDGEFSFDFLLDHTAIDWIDENVFELLYQLFSTTHGHSLTVSVLVDRANPLTPTMSGLWPVAEWQEREVYDLFGVLYDDHPDLRRLFLEDDWSGHPLRKDYEDKNMLRQPQ